MKLRKATIDDCVFVYNIRNEQSVRESSFNLGEINYSEHVKWFKRALISKDKTIYIIENNGEKVGFLRVDKISEISIAIIEDERKKGIAMKALKEIENFVNGKIIAKIKTENKQSINLFKKAGYKFENIKDKYEVMIK